MSFSLSKRSYNRLKDVDFSLIRLCDLAIKRTPIDFGVAYLGGMRIAAEQNDLFKAGFSTKDGYQKYSKHQLGRAVDLMPFVGGTSVESEQLSNIIAGVVFSCASELNLNIRWGGNWANDADPRDNGFRDLYHFELI